MSKDGFYVYREFFRILGTTGGFLFSRMLDEYDEQNEVWMPFNQIEWMEKMVFTRRQLSYARKKLRVLGLIEEKKEGLPPLLLVKINTDKINEVLL